MIISRTGLKLHECGIPQLMALELLKPFLYARLEAKGCAIKGNRYEVLKPDIRSDFAAFF
ncbi:hypothetical protein [Candidatus Liberibacter sp.]|uniref:hypothetical protein n=1 Tax=Candidatus Liberibacter sp. TaxID=34022 RepID=UPI0015F63FD2|nr:hypothetical protein [Candidatus Liberibacter sp.]MBA5724074.1 hypothetical protein [Candidatus Liberibacter sp.]